tara:strand:+ start:1592 stop:2287 length:696 start_codon:yes stop_codon:yes gene_type:complete
MKGSKDLVSVLLSTYNSESTIKRAINSLIDQSYEEIEILIMDDASSDNSYNICKNYERDYKNIRAYKNHENLGLTRSLNLLIKEAKGAYIARQDADDFSHKLRIEKQIEFLNSYNLHACSTRAKIINTERVIPNLSFFVPPKLTIKYKNPFIHGSLLIRSEILKILNNYDERFYYAQDYKLMKDLLINGYKAKIMKQHFYYLNMKNNISTNFSEEQNYYANCVRKNLTPVR